MSLSVDEIAREAEKLSPGERDELMRRLAIQQDADPDVTPEEVEAAWADEIKKRVDDVDNGQVETIPEEEVCRKLRTKRRDD